MQKIIIITTLISILTGLFTLKVSQVSNYGMRAAMFYAYCETSGTFEIQGCWHGDRHILSAIFLFLLARTGTVLFF